ncbi:hypothetical protein FLK61_31090 [Paenalkalicoccus suaedae]|uniref:Uncharacterized protein n=1 Tax=Paenalkalicoccus suaedae TaxID=2592382 RepID=A0A859FE52_9BACI|nr:hypothetical protein [Paenalkalicoccus suaedae]QKS71161.1 hypothetical protein FLK61_31090 [Paenalkalicoccus suaedae]
MILSEKDKKIIISALKKEKRRLFTSQSKASDVQEVIDKIEQSRRNSKTNEVTPSKL